MDDSLFNSFIVVGLDSLTHLKIDFQPFINDTKDSFLNEYSQLGSTLAGSAHPKEEVGNHQINSLKCSSTSDDNKKDKYVTANAHSLDIHCYNRSNTHHVLESKFESQVLFCYPIHLSPPAFIEYFCFPHGVKIVPWKVGPSPEPSWHCFVMTDATGQRIYCTAAIIYQQASKEIISSLKVLCQEWRNKHMTHEEMEVYESILEKYQTQRKIHYDLLSSDIESTNLDCQNTTTNKKSLRESKEILDVLYDLLFHNPQYHPHSYIDRLLLGSHEPNLSCYPHQLWSVWVPLAIVFTSYFPFFSSMKDCLALIVKTFNMKENCIDDDVSLERLVVTIVSEIPTPHYSQCSVIMPLLKSLCLQYSRPGINEVPIISDLPLFPLFQTLDLKTIVRLYEYILLEYKILIVSDKAPLLTVALESLSRLLLFPFYWTHVYVPLLPVQMLDYLYTPFPYLIGYHIDSTEETKECLISLLIKLKECENIIVVSLDDSFLFFQKTSVDVSINEILKMKSIKDYYIKADISNQIFENDLKLPKKERKKLMKNLKSYCCIEPSDTSNLILSQWLEVMNPNGALVPLMPKPFDYPFVCVHLLESVRLERQENIKSRFSNEWTLCFQENDSIERVFEVKSSNKGAPNERERWFEFFDDSSISSFPSLYGSCHSNRSRIYSLKHSDSMVSSETVMSESGNGCTLEKAMAIPSFGYSKKGLHLTGDFERDSFLHLYLLAKVQVNSFSLGHDFYEVSMIYPKQFEVDERLGLLVQCCLCFLDSSENELMYCPFCKLLLHSRCLPKLCYPCTKIISDDDIRSSFLKVWTSLLKNYRQFIYSVDGVENHDQFESIKFIESFPTEASKFLQEFTRTQLFTTWILDRCCKLENDLEVLLWDELIKEKLSRSKWSTIGSSLYLQEGRFKICQTLILMPVETEDKTGIKDITSMFNWRNTWNQQLIPRSNRTFLGVNMELNEWIGGYAWSVKRKTRLSSLSHSKLKKILKTGIAESINTSEINRRRESKIDLKKKRAFFDIKLEATYRFLVSLENQSEIEMSSASYRLEQLHQHHNFLLELMNDHKSMDKGRIEELKYLLVQIACRIALFEEDHYNIEK